MNKFGLSLLSAPAIEPVSVEQAKAHLRVDFSLEDELIASLITAAREMVENILNCSIYTQTWKLTLDSFPYPQDFQTIAPYERNPYANILSKFALVIPQGGVTSVVSIRYMASGSMTTLDSSQYMLDTNAKPCRIMLLNGYSWPTIDYMTPGAVEVNFTAGSYGDGSNTDTCPLAIKQAILLLVGHLYANREAMTSQPLSNLQFGVDALLSPYKVYTSC